MRDPRFPAPRPPAPSKCYAFPQARVAVKAPANWAGSDPRFNAVKLVVSGHAVFADAA